ncbi:MAG: OmpH family outer membrane protein [Firmicutes bacterium]|nr:OmpH family outer membrane protein [Bacillota bacterium]MCM1401920.1 OmpH family outer membrane protein [Bacteroides sp.]MCM1476658.1 OmpH family outer membrane protein [Bacteroides sp.]
MKKLIFATLSLSAILASASVMSCAGNQTEADNEKTAQTAAPEKKAEEPQILKIRYIDGDSITANYNFAKDLKESAVRAYSKLEAAQQSRQNEIQTFGRSIESKMKTNGYLSEESYKADMMKLQKMQGDAENYLGNLQRNTEMELAQQQQQLNDSIEAYIKEYNKAKGYDAILFKAAGVYFNPSLDITNEVLKGLNERYNKVSKK